MPHAKDANVSRDIWSLAALVPTNGFANAEMYRAWAKDHKWELDQAIEIARGKQASP